MPDGWQPPGPPEDWTYKAPAGLPSEEKIDNPGKWNLNSYAPKMNSKTKEYVGHFTPSGTTVVPEDENSDCVVGRWKFHYTGWTPDAFDNGTYVHGDAVYNNLKPESWRGSLDKFAMELWMGGHPHACFDPLMYDAMSYSCWRSIKRFFKLNNNMTDTKKKGDDGYDPCCK